MSWAAFSQATGGECIGAAAPDMVVEGVSTDNRTVRPGQVFFCIRGERFDGHDFAASAVEQGAVAVVTDRDISLSNAPVLRVDDTVRALGRLAHAWRMNTKAKVIGVTGTAGKTTVKELLAAVLSLCGRTAKNELNLNNQIGLPLSVLAADGEEVFWVMEVGISHKGDMDDLGAILKPDIALILNAGAGHVAGLGRGVARHKARLLAWLAPGGTGIVCADYPELAREARAVRPAPAHLEFFTASGKPIAYSGGYLGAAEQEGRGRYRVCRSTGCREVDAPFRGAYGAENVMAVSATACELGLSLDEVAAGLAVATLPERRLACMRLGPWLLVDDSYNANPLSGVRMLESAAGMASDMARTTQADIPLVCVLGEMLELGELAEEEHEKFGRHIAACGASLVIWKGGQAAAVRYGLKLAGYDGAFVELEQAGDVAGILEQYGMRGGVILFKGSRGNRLEECVARFKVLVETSDAV